MLWEKPRQLKLFCVTKEADKSLTAESRGERKMNQTQSMLIDGLTRTKHVANAALIRIVDGNILATTPGFNIQSQALVFLQAFFKELLQVRRDGLYFKDRYYKCVRADDHSIYLKGKDNGVILAKTGTFIVVGTYAQGMYPSVCVEAVEKLADYFRAKGN
ncbi:profilin-4 [Podarcis raffonei]|uniref:profilin-4 n=1 Tax=Podarcis raffonei TaxID=65483 RepID=UPI0023298B8A|nr:profilin-4 [Podarcis raffonei]